MIICNDCGFEDCICWEYGSEEEEKALDVEWLNHSTISDEELARDLDIAICSHCGSYGELNKRCNRGADCPEGVYL